MKSKHERLVHKSDSPVKRRRLLGSLSAYVHQITMNMQHRSNPFQHTSQQGQKIETRAQYHGNRMPMEMTGVIDGSPFHGQGHASTMAVLPPYHRGPIPMDSPRVSAQENQFLEHRLYSHVPQTPSPQSMDLMSPPKPRRVASTAAPFPVTPQSYSYPVQARFVPHQPQVPRNIKMSTMAFYYQVVGHPSLKIFRVRLPPHLLHLLDGIVLGCEAHAATLPNGWFTDLYSLTKQDIALRKIPHLYDAAKPITSYMKRSIMALLGVQTIRMDRNQPHVLKYSKEDGHTGVELHHDKCDVTANLCLSRSSSYVGGGTMLPAAHQVVRLEFGEFLIHPGSLVHGGKNITSGTRHLMILFANVK